MLKASTLRVNDIETKFLRMTLKRKIVYVISPFVGYNIDKVDVMVILLVEDL